MADKAQVIASLRDAIIEGYEAVSNVSGQIGHTISNAMYGGFHDLFYNSIAYNLIGIILVVWCIKHLKSGFSKDDLFKGGMWLIILAFVYGGLSSAGAYEDFKKMFNIPANILTYVIAGASDGKNVAEIMGDTISKSAEIHEWAWEYGFTKENSGFWSWIKPDAMSAIWVTIVIFMYWIVIIGKIIIAIFVMVMQIASYLGFQIFSSLACVMLPLLLMPQTRQNFFAWMRNVIAISLYLPMSLLPMLAINKMDSITLGSNDPVKAGQYLWDNVIASTLFGFFACVISFFLLKKIPEWVNVITGSNETGSGFDIGAAQGIVASPVSAYSAVKEGSKKVAGGISSIAKGASNTKAFAGGMLNSITGKGGKGGGGQSKDGFTAKAGGLTDSAGKGMDKAGKGMQMGGNAMMKAGAGMSSTGVGAIAGVPLMALGLATTAAGIATRGAGMATRVAGKTTQAVGRGMDAVSQKK